MRIEMSNIITSLQDYSNQQFCFHNNDNDLSSLLQVTRVQANCTIDLCTITFEEKLNCKSFPEFKIIIGSWCVRLYQSILSAYHLFTSGYHKFNLCLQRVCKEICKSTQMEVYETKYEVILRIDQFLWYGQFIWLSQSMTQINKVINIATNSFPTI